MKLHRMNPMRNLPMIDVNDVLPADRDRKSGRGRSEPAVPAGTRRPGRRARSMRAASIEAGV
jgi:hypothetical protein